MAKHDDLEFINFVLCDDCRKEDNGKEILIGVYSGNVLVQNFPANLHFCIWLQFRTKISGAVKVDFRLLNKDDEIFSASGKLDVNENIDGLGSINLNGIFITISANADMAFEVKVEEGDWERVSEFKILQNSNL